MTEKTINYYNRNAQSYCLENNFSAMHPCRDKFTSLLPEKGHILDLGCGSGRDSLAFLNLGYTVTAMDGSEEIATVAEATIGQKVRVQLIQALEIKKEFDGIWACASLLHIPHSQQLAVFKKIAAALRSGGIWYMSFKYGKGRRRDERNRLFADHRPDSLIPLLNQLADIHILDIYTTTSILRNHPQKWLNVFCRKKAA